MVPPLCNTEENLDYFGPMPDISYYGVNEMGIGEREEFLAWYEARKSLSFHNKHVLEAYCQDDVTDLRQPCPVFRREFCRSEISRFFLNP